MQVLKNWGLLCFTTLFPVTPSPTTSPNGLTKKNDKPSLIKNLTRSILLLHHLREKWEKLIAGGTWLRNRENRVQEIDEDFQYIIHWDYLNMFQNKKIFAAHFVTILRSPQLQNKQHLYSLQLWIHFFHYLPIE